RVTAHQVLGLLVHGGQEDDGNSGSLRPLPDQSSGFIAVHVWHEYVEENDGEFALQQLAQSSAARGRSDYFGERLEHLGQRQQVTLVVVDQKDAGACLFGTGGEGGVTHDVVCADVASCVPTASLARPIQTRRRASRRSMSTGFEM